MKKAFSYTLTGLLIAISIFFASCLVQILVTPQSNYGVARIYGHSFLYVATDSMVGDKADSLPIGTGIVVKAIAPEQLHQGDVVSFYDIKIGAVNTHRLDADPKPLKGGYSFHTMADNASSSRYSYSGESFTEKELIGFVISHNDALGSFLSFVSPTASGAKEASGGGVSLAWLFPVLCFTPIIVILGISFAKMWRKQKKEASVSNVTEAPIAVLPQEAAEESDAPLFLSDFDTQAQQALLYPSYPRSALLYLCCDESEMGDVLIALKEAFHPQFLGQENNELALFLSPAFVEAEFVEKSKRILDRFPSSRIGLAFFPGLPAEDLLFQARDAIKNSSRLGIAIAEKKKELTLQSALGIAMKLGFEQAGLYLRSAQEDAYCLYAECTADGYHENRCQSKEEIEPYLEVIKEGEIGLALDAKVLPCISEKTALFYAKRFDGGAILFRTSKPISLSSEQIYSLLEIGDFLAKQGFFLKESMQKQAFSTRLETLLEHEDSYAYEVDRDSYRLLYVSSALKKKLSSLPFGARCHKALYGLLSPCPRCPLQRKGDIQKALPILGSQTMRFRCVNNGEGNALILLTKAKSQKETPLSFIEAFESALRQNKKGLVLLIQGEGSEEENRCFFLRAKKALVEAGYGENRYDYEGGIAYLLPQTTIEESKGIVDALEKVFGTLNPPPLSYYRFAFPYDVSCRLELETSMRYRKKNLELRGQNKFVE